MRVFAVAVLLITCTVAHAQYSWQQVFTNLPAFSNPVELVPANDGTNRFFVAQQRGIIYVFENTPDVSTRKTFLNIADSVSQSGSETGLLGLAFHPNYRSNGYFYVNHTNTVGSLRSYIVRYQVSPTNPDSAIKSSRFVLFTVNQPFSNHNGGKIEFGPDGYLYIGLGDGGSANDPGNRALNRAEMLGKILRINVDSMASGLNYAIPPTNPFYNNTQGYRQEIYAYGIRNPWKFSFDPVTDSLWLGDVGQDAREEIDVVSNGGNYGWRLMEGFICNPTVNPTCQDTAGLIRPIWDYVNGSGSNADGSITGGYVYRGSAIPSLYGKYIYGDYLSGRTWALTYNWVTPPTNMLLEDTPFLVSTFGVDTAQNIYLCTYSSSNGRIYKLTGPSTDVDGTVSAPSEFALEQNYPNPFNPKTRIVYRVPSREFVELRIFDVLGREVTALVNEVKEPGTYEVEWDAGPANGGSAFASGVYVYRLISGSHIQQRKMLLVK